MHKGVKLKKSAIYLGKSSRTMHVFASKVKSVGFLTLFPNRAITKGPKGTEEWKIFFTLWGMIMDHYCTIFFIFSPLYYICVCYICTTMCEYDLFRKDTLQKLCAKYNSRTWNTVLIVVRIWKWAFTIARWGFFKLAKVSNIRKMCQC